MYKQKTSIINGPAILLLAILNAVIIQEAYVNNPKWYPALILTLPLLLLCVFSTRHRKTVHLRKKRIHTMNKVHEKPKTKSYASGY